MENKSSGCVDNDAVRVSGEGGSTAGGWCGSGDGGSGGGGCGAINHCKKSLLWSNALL